MAFGASREKFHQWDQLTVEWSTQAELGVFTHVAEPDWRSAQSSYEPTEECQALSQGKDTAFIPFGVILSANQIVYQGQQTVSGVACHQYQATHAELGFSDSMKTTQLAPGSSVSYRKPVTKPVQSVVCLGVDDLLPRQVVKGELTVKYSYDPIQMIDVPSASQD